MHLKVKISKMKEMMQEFLEREEEMSLKGKTRISAKRLQLQLLRNLLLVVSTRKLKQPKVNYLLNPQLCKHKQKCVVKLFSKSRLLRPFAMRNLFLKKELKELEVLLTSGNGLKPKKVV